MYDLKENSTKLCNVGDNLPFIYENDGYIFLQNYNSTHDLDFYKYSYDENKLENIVYDIENKNEEMNYQLKEFKFFNNNFYLIYNVESRSNDKTNKNKKIIKLDSNGNSKELDIDNNLLNVNDESYNKIDIDVVDDLFNFIPMDIVNDKIEVYFAVVCYNDKYDDIIRDYYLKKIIIDESNFEIENIIDYNDDRLKFIRINGLDHFCMKTIIGNDFDIFYSMELSENYSGNLIKYTLDKQGNIVNEIKKEFASIFEAKKVQFSLPTFVDENNLYMTYVDIEKYKFYVGNISFATKNGINIEKTSGGKIFLKTDKDLFINRDEISLNILPDEGYYLKELKFYDKDGNDNNKTETTYTTLNKFNPITYDNIIKYVIIGALSIVIVGLSVILIIKNKRKN